MIPLPVEVLSSIFNQLVQTDQLECMTVCRRWYDIILDLSLFRFIYIDHQQQLDQLIERVKRDPFLGKKVERLTLDMEFKSTYNSDNMFELFPNIRQFVTVGPWNMSYTNPMEQTKDHPWCECIETMVERDDKLTMALLNSGLCKNLTYIAVAGDTENSERSVIKALANAPGLKMLTLFDYALSFQDLEFLHQALPVLETLILENVYFERDSFPRNIKPAISIKVLRRLWIVMYNSNHSSQFLSYVSQKYTHLEELGLIISAYDPDEEENIDETESYEQFKAKITSYMTTLAPHLKTLSLYLYSSANIYPAFFDFNTLDECGCQIRTLTLSGDAIIYALERVAATTQVRSIQSLTLINFKDIKSSVTPLKWLRRFTALKELKIKFITFKAGPPRTILNLTNLLENLREHQLETLKLYGLKLELKDSSIIHTHSSLKELVLRYVDFPTGTDIFISRAFPNMKRLKLDKPFNQQEVINLPELDLSYLKVINRSATQNSSIMLVTLDNNQRRLYCASTKKPFRNFRFGVKKEMFPPPFIFSKDGDGSDTIPVITITCKSVFSFVMRNYEIDPKYKWYNP